MARLVLSPWMPYPNAERLVELEDCHFTGVRGLVDVASGAEYGSCCPYKLQVCLDSMGRVGVAQDDISSDSITACVERSIQWSWSNAYSKLIGSCAAGAVAIHADSGIVAEVVLFVADCLTST